MPKRAMQPCAGRCGGLVERGHCAGCQARGKGPVERKTSCQRGYGAKWQKVSRAYLAAHPRCVDPYGEHGEVVVAATETDHVIPHRGNMRIFWDSTQWQPLCHRCHSRKTALEDGGFGR